MDRKIRAAETHRPPRKEHLIFLDRVHRLYEQTALGAGVAVINAAILTLVLWPMAPKASLWVWLASALMVSTFRLTLHFLYRRYGAGGDRPEQWQIRSIWTLAASGCVWGATGIFFFPETSVPVQTFISFVLGGMVAGSASAFSAVMPAFFAFSVPALFPAIAMFFMMFARLGDPIHGAMGVMLILFWSAMVLTARHFNRTIQSVLELKHDKASLITDLEVEIQERKRIEAELKEKNKEIESIVEKRTAELVKAELGLRESEQRYVSLYSSMNEGVCLHEMIFDDDGKPADYRIIDVNPAYEAMTGINREANLGLKGSDLYGGGAPPFLETYARVAETGEPTRFEVFWPPMEKHLSISAFSPTKGKFATVFSDITEAKHAEAALRKNAHELVALNRLGKAINVSLSLDDTIREALDQAVVALDTDVVIFFLKSDTDLKLAGVAPKGSRYARHDIPMHRIGECLCGLATQQARAVFSTNIQKDSRCTWNDCRAAGLCSVAAVPVKSGDEVIGVLAIGSATERDFSVQEPFLEAMSNEIANGLKNSFLYEEIQNHAEELQNRVDELNRAREEKTELQNRLVQARKMEAIGTLAGGIAHDFNNILSAIMGYTELTLEDMDPDFPDRRNLEKVIDASNRARNLVKQILTFSRQSEQDIRPVQVKPVISESLQLIRASLPSTVEIRQNLESEAVIIGDPIQLHQVVINLCTNAKQAMQETGGILTVSLNELDIDPPAAASIGNIDPGRYIEMSVEDTGKGIAAENLDRIFDPFFTTKPIGKGTGMGLSVVHGIVESLGGGIVVSSEPENGSVFRVFLPIADQEAAELARVDTSLPRGLGEKILFVDDESFQLDLARQMFERLNYRQVIVNDSTDALRRFEEDPMAYDLVITDMTMPKMTGDVLAKRILEVRPDIPVVLCTGYSEQVDEEKAKALGITAFLMKPVVLRDLAITLRRLLDRSSID